MLTWLLALSLLVVGFYAVENLRGDLTLTAAIREAQAQGVPVSLAGVDLPRPPEEENLFFSPALRNRMIDPGRRGSLSTDRAVSIPWGDIFPVFTGKGRERRPVVTDPRTGRSLEFEPVVEAMSALGWTLPRTGTAAEKVRAGLDRFQQELEEWSSEIRKRPKWSVPVESAVDHEAFERALIDTAKIFGLRAVSGAASGRSGDQILRDLESVALLGNHCWELAGELNPRVWEVVKSRRLTDAELKAAAQWLIEEPPIRPLLRSAYFEGLAYTEGLLSRDMEARLLRGRGPDYGSAFRLAVPLYGPVETWWRKGLSPAGWSGLEDAWQIRCMVSAKHKGEAAVWSWRGESEGERLPPEILATPWWQHRMPEPDWHCFTFGEHLATCGCQLSAVWQAAVDARMAMVMIGLERYRLRHGKWPDHLADAADLIPKGLRRVPGHEDPIGYTLRAEGGWELSVGKEFPKWMMPYPP